MASARRLPAEWEAQSAIQLALPHPNTDWSANLLEVVFCYQNCIDLISRYETVLLLCHDIQEAIRVFGNRWAGDVRYIEVAYNDTWCRDYGPITVEENGKHTILDFTFNGWGLKFPSDLDNQTTRHLWDRGLLNADRIATPDLVLEGGSIESDGAGTILTTTQCLTSPNRNRHLNKLGLEIKLTHFLGASRVLWLDHGALEGDDTDAHIDTLVRFCSKDTIAYVMPPKFKDPHVNALKRMEQQLKQFKQSNGSPYRLIGLPFPDPIFNDQGERLPATYANFLIINKAVIVPQYGVKQDEQAIQAIQKAFPYREIHGLYCRPLIEQGGSLHCISMQYPKGIVL